MSYFNCTQIYFWSGKGGQYDTFCFFASGGEGHLVRVSATFLLMLSLLFLEAYDLIHNIFTSVVVKKVVDLPVL